MPRKDHLQRLTSPDQLDRLLVLVRLPAWISLGFIYLLITAILVWACIGRIPSLTTGRGIYFDPQSVELLQSDREGVINEVLAKEGGDVSAGQPVLTVRNPTEFEELLQVKNEIFSLTESARSKQALLEIRLKEQKEILALQKQRLQQLQGAQKGGEYFDLEIAIKKGEEQIELLNQELSENVDAKLRALRAREQELTSTINGRVIRAPSNGTVLEINVLQGQHVSFGNNLIWIQKKDELQKGNVYGFFSSKAGGPIRTGMKVHLTFDTVNTGLYGQMLGTVKEILPYAGGPKGKIVQSIPSQSLRDYLTQNNASFLVIVEPLKDPSTATGYQWTTKKGPPDAIKLGSIVTVQIIIEEKRPISYLIPIGYTPWPQPKPRNSGIS